MTLTFNKGSLILIDYTAKVKDTEEVFDTTLEADAKKYSIHEIQKSKQEETIIIRRLHRLHLRIEKQADFSDRGLSLLPPLKPGIKREKVSSRP